MPDNDNETNAKAREMREAGRADRREERQAARQDEILNKIVDQQNTTNILIGKIDQRTELHSKEIADLRKDGVDIGKLLAAMQVKFNIFQWIGISIGGLLLTYIFSHFIH